MLNLKLNGKSFVGKRFFFWMLLGLIVFSSGITVPFFVLSVKEERKPVVNENMHEETEFLLAPTLPPAPDIALAPTPAATPRPTTVRPMPKATPKPTPKALLPSPKVFGYSVKGRPVSGYVFGSGSETVFLFATIHGHEKGPSSLLNSLVQTLASNPALVGVSKRAVLIPVANPDGYAAGLTRVNANGVDVNRNFQTAGWTKYQTLDGATYFCGSGPFSEPESRVIRDVAVNYNVSKMIAFHAQGNLVNPEYLHGPSQALARWYSQATGYGYYEKKAWDYAGTATKWFVENYPERPGVTVEVSSLTASDWTKNKSALLSLLK